MADYNSKYSGEQVEALLDQVASGNAGGGGGGGIAVETDPIFSASPAASITEEKIAEWNSKSAQGEKGEKGDKGDTGVGVQSVAQTTTSNADGGSNVVTVTLTDGTKSTFTVKNGSKGSQGIQGIQGEQGPKGDKGDTGANGTNGTNGKDGADGATFTPSVDAAGNLSWSNDKGLTNPPTVNIKGPKGDKGDAGEGGGSSGGGKELILNSPLYFDDASPVQPNKIYIKSTSSFSYYIGAFQEVSDYDEYCIIFKYPEGSFYLLESVKFANGQMPTIEYDTECELSVVGIGSGTNRTYHAVLTPFKAI